MPDNKGTVEVGGKGIGLASALGIVFIALKLTGHIDWSWIWVLCPFWVGIVLIIGILVVGGGVIALLACIAKIILKVMDRVDKQRRRRRAEK